MKVGTYGCEGKHVVDHVLKMNTPGIHFHDCKRTAHFQESMSFFNDLRVDTSTIDFSRCHKSTGNL